MVNDKVESHAENQALILTEMDLVLVSNEMLDTGDLAKYEPYMCTGPKKSIKAAEVDRYTEAVVEVQN